MRSSSLFVAWVLGIAIAVAIPGSDAEAQRVVLISHAGPPLHADELAPLLDSFEQAGFLVAPSKVRLALGPRFPMAAHEPAMTVAAFARILEQANLLWIRQPPLEQMLPVLDRAVALAAENPALLILDPSLRTRFHQLLVARALAYQRAGDVKRSEDSMAELICTAPNQTVSRSKDGPAAEQLYQLTRANLNRRGRGTLTVNVNDPDVQVYIDERIARPNVPVADLIPCTHRIVVIDRLERARRYEVQVWSNQHTVLDIDWRIDPAVQVTPRWVQLGFQTETERVQRAERARALIHAATGADAFVLVDVAVEPGGRRRIVASLRGVRRNRTLREASTEMIVNRGRGTEAMSALARFIGGHPPSAAIEVHALVDVPVRGDAHGEPVTDEPAAPTRRRRVLKYVVTAVAGAVIAGGGAMIYLGDVQICDASERDPTGQCPRLLTLGGPGVITLAAGVALGAVGGYLWYAERASRARVAVALDPSRRGGFVVATWRLP